MSEQLRPGRGSYIWGRSVHNIRIERLWVDFADGIANKWKDFFYELELYYGLCADSPAHIWLLHHLFLDAINADVQDWVEVWNSHKIQLEDGRRSPREMFTFGLLEQGPRGLDTLLRRPADLYRQEEEAFAHIEEFGVDWVAQSNPNLLQHHALNNNLPADEGNPFTAFTTPETLNEVVVDPPTSPLTIELVAMLDQTLAARVDLTSRNMGVRKLVWQEALAICTSFYHN
ncbi:hypothetical protein C8R45DRAFT_1057388 [Mycena sanguinolenta]|nr:hypothetical protein C8R45DRAFT_1057388 [Mycena sanguinolenta]